MKRMPWRVRKPCDAARHVGWRSGDAARAMGEPGETALGVLVEGNVAEGDSDL